MTSVFDLFDSQTSPRHKVWAPIDRRQCGLDAPSAKNGMHFAG